MTAAPSDRTITAALRRMSRPAGSFDAARYFRGDHRLKFYNVGTERMRSLARGIYDANKAAWTVRDAMRLADVLMRDPYLETNPSASSWSPATAHRSRRRFCHGGKRGSRRICRRTGRRPTRSAGC